MKKIYLLILSMVLVCSVVSAQTETAQKADTVEVSSGADTNTSSLETSEFSHDSDDDDLIEQKIDEAVNSADFVFPRSLDREFGGFTNITAMIPIVAIVVGLPCIVIIIALFLIFYYVSRRNRERNALINKAIDHNYQLPESFFQSTSPQKDNRDPKRFYSGWTFIAFGVGFIVVALGYSSDFSLLVGVICLLIGIGRMIGYYCIPNGRYNGPYNGPMPPYGCQQPPFQPPYQQPEPGQQQPYQQPYQQQSGQQPYQQPTPDQSDQPDQNGPQNTPPPYNPVQ